MTNLELAELPLGGALDVSQGSPSCNIINLDVSSSTENKVNGERVIDALLRMLNTLLRALGMKSLSGVDFVDRFYIGLIAFESSATSAVPHLTGPDPKLLSSRELFPFPLRVDTAGDTKTPIFVDGLAPHGGTAMNEALVKSLDLAKGWVQARPDGNPPRVIVVTDGEWNGADPTQAAQDIKALKTTRGNATLWIAFVGPGTTVSFPVTADELPNTRYARHMFELASVLPDADVSRAKQHGLDVRPGARALVFNGDLSRLPDFLRFASL